MQGCTIQGEDRNRVWDRSIGEKARVNPLENGVKLKGARLKWHEAGQH